MQPTYMQDTLYAAPIHCFTSTTKELPSMTRLRLFDGSANYCVSKSAEYIFGDQFQLLHHFKASKPWKRTHFTPSATSKKPSELLHDELEKEVVDQLFATQKQKTISIFVITLVNTLDYCPYNVIIGVLTCSETHHKLVTHDLDLQICFKMMLTLLRHINIYILVYDENIRFRQ
ncbi:RNA-dependent RNA polymerase, eukaryotic-type [Artemisia annua]|uniref:RNA-dependent RNA polymerase, eukaryotic-type n=1 Tax=Artemisia annua TaxID=35608 RepID=A0A2U1N4L0_ARTAN|nr:RNA-dependent RNA polymerase, eukaryotic-type [Artemisia annua]